MQGVVARGLLGCSGWLAHSFHVGRAFWVVSRVLLKGVLGGCVHVKKAGIHYMISALICSLDTSQSQSTYSE